MLLIFSVLVNGPSKSSWLDCFDEIRKIVQRNASTDRSYERDALQVAPNGTCQEMMLDFFRRLQFIRQSLPFVKDRLKEAFSCTIFQILNIPSLYITCQKVGGMVRLVISSTDHQT